MTGNTDKERCPLCLGEEDILLDYLETISWKMTLLNRKLLVMNKVAKCRKILTALMKISYEVFVMYLDKIKYKWFYRTKVI